MATSTQIPLAEYLATSYRPDREYIDGEVVERNMGTWEHGRLQMLLGIWFGQHEAEWGVMVAAEWRTQVSETRIRIPDVTVVISGPQTPVLHDAPLLLIEILSPDDTYSATERKAQDYMRMGVNTVWIIDPETRTGRMCIGATWTAATRLEVPGTPIYVELPNLFAGLAPTR
ncbi:Endonuclease, Uma2 family (restriction endonuclease fold) [Granulicella pectinivorans]|uniref:Endonuclease, Uma2 family (Restriction endonuclease fold) n=1 Tax=Granulicella pectinivorans TaxID=474950 RepID=A0A1I6MKD9_9BACT|nr:Uma2 family endonuclease [Granulicella pectinivorans]SFS16078.1 Endonuclease, Uma2 family (restriction endonuclease fold) [Granulicella pectinivorans]